MGLYQDQTNALSEIKRLAALVLDPMRRLDIGDDQWPLAIIAYGLATCNNFKYQESLEIYQTFESKCPSQEIRCRCLLQLAQFVRQRQGNGWRALLPFAIADSDETVCRQAAFLTITLAEPSSDESFVGAVELLKLIVAPSCKNPQALLDALLGLGDLRFMPYLDKFAAAVRPAQLQAFLEKSSAIPNALSCGWMLKLLDSQPSLTDTLVRCFIAMPARAEQILDVVVPIPSWKFKNSSIQPLHGWSRPEYFARMLNQFSRNLSPQQIENIRAAWC